jgi:hypothetical protein
MRPGTSQRPELDLLAVAAVVALFWLIAGELAGRSVLVLFNLSFAAVALGFAALATRGWWRLVLLPLGAAIAGLFTWVSALNTPWHPPWSAADWPWLVVALAVPAGLAMFRPEFFTTHRSAKLFATALLVPLVFYFRGMVS